MEEKLPENKAVAMHRPSNESRGRKRRGIFPRAFRAAVRAGAALNNGNDLPGPCTIIKAF